jgi:hypothetical protein
MFVLRPGLACRTACRVARSGVRDEENVSRRQTFLPTSRAPATDVWHDCSGKVVGSAVYIVAPQRLAGRADGGRLCTLIAVSVGFDHAAA